MVTYQLDTKVLHFCESSGQEHLLSGCNIMYCSQLLCKSELKLSQVIALLCNYCSIQCFLAASHVMLYGKLIILLKYYPCDHSKTLSSQV